MSKQNEQVLDEIQRLVQNNDALHLIDGAKFGGGTNYICCGEYDGEPVVFKYFWNVARKQQEALALKIFADTESVPKLYPIEDDHILVMQRFSGLPFYQVEDQVTFEQWQGLFYQLGVALAHMVARVPGQSVKNFCSQSVVAELGIDYSFYCQADLDVFVDTVMESAAGALSTKDVPHAELLKGTLSTMQANRDALLALPRFVYMDDFHYANMIADGPNFQGFVDFEMTRYGNEALVLAGVLNSIPSAQKERWLWVRQGYEAERGKALDDTLIDLAFTFASFSKWIRFMWYWSSDALPEWAQKSNVRMSVVEGIKDTVLLMRQMTF